MRSFTTLSFWSLLALAGLVSLTSAAPAVEDCSKSELGCLIAGRSVLPSATIDERDLWTNGERLSRGLPPKSPSRREKYEYAARAQSSPLPQDVHTGYIQLKRGDDVIGYVATTNRVSSGQFTTTTDPANAVRFEIGLDQGETSGSKLDVKMLNIAGFFGLVQGRDDTTSTMATGSFHYLYFNSVDSSTGPGATPQSGVTNGYTSTNADRTVETSVWSIDLNTNAMSVQWVNPDGSITPATQTFTQSNYMYAGGDSGAFVAKYPSPITSITLHFVPATF